MKMLLLDVQENKLKVVEANTLEDYYRLLKCNTIDIVRRYIGGVGVEIICDDEGLLCERPKISALNAQGEPLLVGNLLIAGGKVIDGDLTSISEEEIEVVLENVAMISTKAYPEPYTVFVNMSFHRDLEG